MKKILTFILIFCSFWASAQLSSAKINRIQNNYTDFGFNIPVGDILYDATQKKWYGVALARTSTESIVDLTVNTHIKELTNQFDISVQTFNTANATHTWNVNSGINAKLLIQQNTTITLSNLVAGMTGNLSITQLSTAYTITFAGYTNKISPVIYTSPNVVTCSGSSKFDVFSWYFDGTYLIWNGTKGYQ